MAKLPATLKKYFWDCDFEKLDMDSYRKFIVERILNLGKDEAIAWLMQHIDLEFLKKVVRESRQVDNKTRNYWEIILELRAIS